MIKDRCNQNSTVTGLAKALNHSRSRFYQLLNKGIYPLPQYNISKRPYYPKRIQEECFRIRYQTQVGANKQIIIFNDCSRKDNKQTTDISVTHNPKIAEFIDVLKQMGLAKIEHEQVEASIKIVFPNGLPDNDGLVLRELFRYLSKKN